MNTSTRVIQQEACCFRCHEKSKSWASIVGIAFSFHTGPVTDFLESVLLCVGFEAEGTAAGQSTGQRRRGKKVGVNQELIPKVLDIEATSERVVRSSKAVADHELIAFLILKQFNKHITSSSSSSLSNFVKLK